MQPLEDPEQFIVIAHVKSDAIVFDKIKVLVSLVPAPHLDGGVFLKFGELDGIGQQIHQYLLQQGRVAEGRGRSFRFSWRWRRGNCAWISWKAAALSAARSTRVFPELMAPQPGKGQQVFDELGHVTGISADDLQQPQGLVVQLVSVFQQQHFGKAVNGPDGALRSWILSRKSLQFFVGRLQLGGALSHAPLQLVIELFDLRFGLLALHDFLLQLRHRLP